MKGMPFMGAFYFNNPLATPRQKLRCEYKNKRFLTGHVHHKALADKEGKRWRSVPVGNA